ncbi:MAG TPA: response regulator transcription factor [Actinomycetales bacterium]|nr:response regulator transcription factor [Actinomycetales bacterium]
MSETTDRFVLVEDHGLVAEALSHTLSAAGHRVAMVDPDDATPDKVVAAAGSAGATVVVDLDLGRGADGRRRLGWTLIEPLVTAGHRVMVLTGDLDAARWGRCVSLGATGVVTKALPLQDVVDLAIAASRGEPVMSPAARQEVLRSWDSHRSDRERLQAPLRRLTKREGQVLAHLVDGHSAATIAAMATVSEATVRSQIRAILDKLGVGSQLQAVAAARRAGWSGAPAA